MAKVKPKDKSLDRKILKYFTQDSVSKATGC